MLWGLLDVSILSSAVLRGCYIFGCAVVLVLLFGSWGRRAGFGRWFLRLGILAASGAGIGLVFGWWFSDVWDPLGVALSVPTRVWLCALLAGVGIAMGNLWSTRWWSRIVAIIAIPSIAAVCALGVNADLGEYRTLRAAILGTQIAPLVLPAMDAQGGSPDTPLWESWSAPPGMPQHGRVGTVLIPGTQSHFEARPAIVYLPPAALVADPPELPVIIMMSGEPGQPSDIVDKAGFPEILDSYAKDHHGLAPIVVIPDQLGKVTVNPMCVDSPLGSSQSYLTIDVPRWIKSHLRVRSGPSSWAIAGFSQGGTCAIQLGAGRPELFGSILDISGELAPLNGTLSHTLAVGFDGSRSRYEAATPLKVLAAHTPYPDSVAIFAVGKDDTRFAPGVAVLARAAADAGMTVTSFEIPGTGHDWRCVVTALRQSLPILGTRFGIASG